MPSTLWLCQPLELCHCYMVKAGHRHMWAPAVGLGRGSYAQCSKGSTQKGHTSPLLTFCWTELNHIPRPWEGLEMQSQAPCVQEQLCLSPQKGRMNFAGGWQSLSLFTSKHLCPSFFHVYSTLPPNLREIR